MLVGDFNRLNYRHICNYFNLRQIVKSNKWWCNPSPSFHQLVSQPQQTKEILPGIGLSDHNSLIIRSSVVVQKVKAESISKRIVKPSSKSSFGRWLLYTDWSFLQVLPTCMEILSTFESLLIFSVNRFFPLRKIKKHPTGKPWITPELKTLIQQR